MLRTHAVHGGAGGPDGVEGGEFGFHAAAGEVEADFAVEEGRFEVLVRTIPVLFSFFVLPRVGGL